MTEQITSEETLNGTYEVMYKCMNCGELYRGYCTHLYCKNPYILTSD